MVFREAVVNRDQFARWWGEMRRLEPVHHGEFMAWELEMCEHLRDSMNRLADLEGARALDRAELADRGVGAVGWMVDDDAEADDLREAVDALRRATPWGYNHE